MSSEHVLSNRRCRCRTATNAGRSRRLGPLVAVVACLPLQAGAAAPVDCVTRSLPPLVVHDCRAIGLSVVETYAALEPIVHPVAPLTLRQLSAAMPAYALLLNGTYHSGDYGNAALVGLFTVRGHALSPLRSADPQLSHLVHLDNDNRIVEIEAVASAKGRHLAEHVALRSDASVFQTGPLILEAGVTAAASIEASLNGTDAYKRTAVGRTSDGATVLVVARQPRSLRELAADVSAVGDLARRALTLVNLDGGYSTAWVLRDWPALNYAPDKSTPIAFAVRP